MVIIRNTHTLTIYLLPPSHSFSYLSRSLYRGGTECEREFSLEKPSGTVPLHELSSLRQAATNQKKGECEAEKGEKNQFTLQSQTK